MALTTLAIEESIHIAAAPEIVWHFLAEPRSWQHWWTGCRGAETQDRKTLHDGSELRLALHLGWMTWKFTVRIGATTANRSLAWAGKGGGVGSRHAFYLDAKPNGTFVRQQATFSGPGVLFFRLLRLDAAARRMFHQNLRGLKRAAERAS